MPMHRFLRSLIAAGGAVLAAGLASAHVAARPLPASAVMPQDAAMAPGIVTLAGVRYSYGDRYYLPCYGRRPYYRRYRGYRPCYPDYYGAYPYYAPLTICGTLLCYRPRYFIAPAW
jgi:hypothetical protein